MKAMNENICFESERTLQKSPLDILLFTINTSCGLGEEQTTQTFLLNVVNVRNLGDTTILDSLVKTYIT